MVHAPAADLADGTFKRPPLFKEGDVVEFAAPERRIKVRTFGIVDAVKHVGAQPYYVVTSAKGTIYSFAEGCLRHKGSVDPNFALRGSELVTISDTDAVGTVLMLESVDKVCDESADDLYADAEAGQDNSADGVAVSPDDMARAQVALMMTTFESRLQEHSEAAQSKLHSQLEALVSKQELAHERMLLTLSTQSNAIEQQPIVAAAVNPRLVAPVADDFTAPAPREVPLHELMTSPLQALRSGALADKSRRIRGQVSFIGDDLVAMHVIQRGSPELDECLLEDMAVMVLQSQHQRSMFLRGMDTDSLRNLDHVIETVDVRCMQVCIETGEVVNDRFVMALAIGVSVPVHLDTAFSRDWHKPVTYRDYLHSPQKGLWRTAMELRMRNGYVQSYSIVCTCFR